MSKIKIMNEDLANKIAAGEVVERASSVVKELVENSIDASSKEIKIDLIEAGTKEIKITDNGVGMDETDAHNAFLRHATSKLLSIDDLYHIMTLGFRGEALPSIAAISEVSLKTSPGDIGTHLVIKGGKIIKDEKGDARKGTVITVKNLFYNTPARLKYMKSLYTELANIVEYINKIALSHPDIKFTLTNNGKTLLTTDGNNNSLKVINSIYGLDITKKMIEISNQNNDYIISGYISYPETTRSNRNHMTLIVNGRVVKNNEINNIIIEAYHTYLPEGRYPITILNIEVDPTLIDVNIHPAKLDIKFSKMEELKNLLLTTIREKLEKLTLIPEIKIKETVPSYDAITFDLERTFIEEPISNNIKQEELILDVIEENEARDRLPELYPVGSVHGTYIVCQNEQGMYLIDQHAAKERINYEYYLKKLGNPDGKKIDILIPINIELPKNEYIIIKENIKTLEDLNFDIEEFGINTIIIKAHPTWLLSGLEEQSIRKIIDIIIEKENIDIEKFNEQIAITLSCKMAIKANDFISLEEMERLIDDLRKTNNPFTCPHGRPTIIKYSIYDLERMFKRAM